MQTRVAHVALLHDAAHPRCHSRIQTLLHARGPRRIPPIKIARVIRARRHAIAASQAALWHLHHDPGGLVHFDGLLRAYLHAGRVVFAVHAHNWDECLAARSPLHAIRGLADEHWSKAGASCGLRKGRHVVLGRARHHARAATGAAVQINHLAVMDAHAVLFSGASRKLDSPYNFVANGGSTGACHVVDQFSGCAEGTVDGHSFNSHRKVTGWGASPTQTAPFQSCSSSFCTDSSFATGVSSCPHRVPARPRKRFSQREWMIFSAVARVESMLARNCAALCTSCGALTRPGATA